MKSSDVQISIANMRFAVALCFLAALWTVDANSIQLSDDFDDLRAEVRDAKWTVEDIIRRLQLRRDQAEEDTKRKVTDKWDEEQNSYRSYKNQFLQEIRKIVDASKNKNAEKCYNEAVNGIKESEDVVSENADKCNDVASSVIETNLAFLDNLISTGRDLSSELDSIFLDCHDTDDSKKRGCIVSALADIKNDIKTLNNDANSAEITIVHLSDNIILQATNCLKNAYSFIYSAGSTIQMRLYQCLEQDEVTESITTTRKVTTKAPIKSTTVDTIVKL